MEKQRQQLPHTSTITHLHPASDQAKCCTVAMFLGTMNMPQNGDTLDLGDKALACCREKLCPKFKSEQDCTWISSGDLSWKQKLSDDLDRVQVIDNRLEQIHGDDMDDPSAREEKQILQGERQKIEDGELQRLSKVAPLTAMCDEVLDSDQPGEDLAEEQEARIQCITSFVDIAYGACAWQEQEGQCVSVVSSKPTRSFSWSSTLSLLLVISAILAITYYAAKPAASEGEVEKSEYSSLDQLPPELGGHK
uniref:Uncharacterized protein n=1 Tax=Guillardia theta TaxID=55529 RepID=A0A7S4KJZ3_GUITH